MSNDSAVAPSRLLNGALTLVWLLAACADDPTHANGDENLRPVRVSMTANVIAAPGAVVVAAVSYRPRGASAAVLLGRDSMTVNTGSPSPGMDLTVDVAPCVSAATASEPCAVDVVVRLSRTGALLDENSQRLTVTASTDQLTAAPVQLFEVASVVITPASIGTFRIGDSLLLNASPVDRSGAPVAGRSPVWSVVSGGVTVSSLGLLRGQQLGQATVRAAIGGRTKDLVLTVAAPPLTVASVAPSNGALGVPIESVVAVTFSENVDPTTVSASTITLQRNAVAVSAARTVNGNVVTIAPTALFTEFNSPYVVTITNGVRSVRGGAVAANVTSSFTTLFWDALYNYRVTNNQLGSGRALDTFAGDLACFMGVTGAVPSQSWFFQQADATYATMHNGVSGLSQSLEGAVEPDACFLTPASPIFTGMLWRAVSAAPFAPGAYYLQNLNFGAARSLGTVDDIPQMLPTANNPSQFWNFTRLSRR